MWRFSVFLGILAFAIGLSGLEEGLKRNADGLWLLQASGLGPVSARMLACPPIVSSGGSLFGARPASNDETLNGLVLWHLGQCEQAADSWRAALQEDASLVFARLWLGLYYFQKGEIPRLKELWSAYPALRRIVDGHGYSITDPATQLAWSWLRFYAFPEAITARQVEKPLQLAGKDGEIAAVWRYLADSTDETQRDHWWALGRLAETQGDWASAQQAYLQGLERTSQPDLPLLYNAARMGHLSQDYRSALALYRQVLEAEPENGGALLGAARSASKLEDFPAAIEFYQRLLRLQPDNSEAASELEQICQETGLCKDE